MQVRKIYLGTVLLLAGLFLTGCPSQERIERDFQVRREAAYQRLMQMEPNDTATDLKIVTGGLTRADCIELALQNNKDVQTAKVKLLEAKGQMTDAIAINQRRPPKGYDPQADKMKLIEAIRSVQ